MNVRVPNLEYLVVKADPAETVSAGGIALPTTAEDRKAPGKGRVLAVGADVKVFEPGQRVAWNSMAIKHRLEKREDGDVLAIHMNEFLAVIE